MPLSYAKARPQGKRGVAPAVSGSTELEAFPEMMAEGGREKAQGKKRPRAFARGLSNSYVGPGRYRGTTR